MDAMPTGWSIDEEIRLLEAFRDEHSLQAVAARHRRTSNAIVTRLVRLGHLLPKPDRYIRSTSAEWVTYVTYADLRAMPGDAVPATPAEDNTRSDDAPMVGAP